VKALREQAERCFTRYLAENPYPGRGLVIGRSAADSAWLQVYWIMGRSPNSRNRIFVREGSELRTHPSTSARWRTPR